MTVTALGVDRTTWYPRAVVEPLLWLAVTTGVVWLLVTIDARGQATGGSGAIESGLSQLAAALALVLILNGVSALLLAAQGGSIARGVAGLAGVGLAVSGWGFTLIPEIPPEVRHWLLLGSIVAGVVLAVGSQMQWKEIAAPPGVDERGAIELVVILVLGAFAAGLAWVAYESLAYGLVGVGGHQQSAWSDFLPAMQGVAALMATIGQLWNRRWLASVVTFVVGTTVTVALFLVTG